MSAGARPENKLCNIVNLWPAPLAAVAAQGGTAQRRIDRRRVTRLTAGALAIMYGYWVQPGEGKPLLDNTGPKQSSLLRPVSLDAQPPERLDEQREVGLLGEPGPPSDQLIGQRGVREPIKLMLAVVAAGDFALFGQKFGGELLVHGEGVCGREFHVAVSYGRMADGRVNAQRVTFGDMALPDLLVALAACERRNEFSGRCGAKFTDLARRPGVDS